jgi:hypothetical protein
MEYKEYYNEIIPPWDPRYGKLGHIWKKYNWNELISGEDRSIYYYIPPELVLTEIKSYQTILKVITNDPDSYNNWVNRQCISKYLHLSCNLEVQEYFDLLNLKINSSLNRPKCDYCHSYLEFSGRLGRGYNSSTPWNNDQHHYCNHSCQMGYRFNHPEEFTFIPELLTKMVRNREYTRYDRLSKSILYISTCEYDDLYKFGITVYSNFEPYRYGGNIAHILVKSTRDECANIEARLKLKFNGSEWINKKDLHNFIKELKDILLTRPVSDPFI